MTGALTLNPASGDALINSSSTIDLLSTSSLNLKVGASGGSALGLHIDNSGNTSIDGTLNSSSITCTGAVSGGTVIANGVNLISALTLKAPLMSPALTGSATLGGSAIQTAATLATALQPYAPLVSPAFTGSATLAGSAIQTAATLATTLQLYATDVSLAASLAAYAPLASPALTGSATLGGSALQTAATLNTALQPYALTTSVTAAISTATAPLLSTSSTITASHLDSSTVSTLNANTLTAGRVSAYPAQTGGLSAFSVCDTLNRYAVSIPNPTLTAARTVTLPDASGQVVLSSGGSITVNGTSYTMPSSAGTLLTASSLSAYATLASPSFTGTTQMQSVSIGGGATVNLGSSNAVYMGTPVIGNSSNANVTSLLANSAYNGTVGLPANSGTLLTNLSTLPASQLDTSTVATLNATTVDVTGSATISTTSGASTQLVISNSSSSAASNPAVTIMQSALPTNGSVQMNVGASSAGSNNLYYMQFVNSGGTGSTANHWGVGLGGHGLGLTLNGAGAVATTNSTLDDGTGNMLISSSGTGGQLRVAQTASSTTETSDELCVQHRRRHAHVHHQSGHGVERLGWVLHL